MMHLEFVVLGPPVSNQGSPANVAAWQTKVKAEAAKLWTKPPLTGMLKSIIINFHEGDKPTVDVDNMAKPIHDALNKLVYDDDRQIRITEIVHLRISAPMILQKVAKILVDAVQKGDQFLYIRIEDCPDVIQLPK